MLAVFDALGEAGRRRPEMVAHRALALAELGRHREAEEALEPSWRRAQPNSALTLYEIRRARGDAAGALAALNHHLAARCLDPLSERWRQAGFALEALTCGPRPPSGGTPGRFAAGTAAAWLSACCSLSILKSRRRSRRRRPSSGAARLLPTPATGLPHSSSRCVSLRRPSAARTAGTRTAGTRTAENRTAAARTVRSPSAWRPFPGALRCWRRPSSGCSTRRGRRTACCSSGTAPPRRRPCRRTRGSRSTGRRSETSPTSASSGWREGSRRAMC